MVLMMCRHPATQRGLQMKENYRLFMQGDSEDEAEKLCFAIVQWDLLHFLAGLDCLS